MKRRWQVGDVPEHYVWPPECGVSHRSIASQHGRGEKKRAPSWALHCHIVHHAESAVARTSLSMPGEIKREYTLYDFVAG